MNYHIIPLEKEKWKGFNLPIGYTTNEYYDVALTHTERGFDIGIIKKAFPAPVTHSQADYDYPDNLYADWWEKAEAFGVAENGRLLAAVEICPEDWTNRLIVTELWVSEELRGKGYGKKLIDLAKAETLRRKHRALILETQSCNVNAVDFYLHQGFILIGLDTCCYSNNDLARKEVRLNMGWFPEEADFDMETAAGKTNALLQTSAI